MATRLIVDTDTAGDDAFSLLLALLHPDAQLEAVTVVCGNVDFDQEVANALYTIEVAGRSGEVPVHPGCGRPRLRERTAAELLLSKKIHGMDGMGDSHFPPAEQRPSGEHAVDAILRIVSASPGEVSILAHGPLTNIAAACIRDPSLPRKTRGLWVMGGTNNSLGNVTPSAEFNFWVDPEAASLVLRAGFSLTLVTWTTTLSHGVFSLEQLAAIAALDTPRSRFFGDVNRASIALNATRGIAGSTHPDSLTCAVLLDPTLATRAGDYFVDVETAGTLTRGYSCVDLRGELHREPNAHVVEAVDNARFFGLMLDVLSR